MAKGKGEIKGWITRNGIHIPIYSHYSVRGGEEPKTKGARWKKKKELSPRQVRQATTYLSTSNKESIKAVKAELNKMDDSKEVFSGVTVKDLKEHFSGVDENTTLGEYRKQLFDKDDQDTPIKEGKEKKYASKVAEMRAKGMSSQEIKEAKQTAKDNAREKEFQKEKAFAEDYWNKEDAKTRAAGKEPKGRDTILDYDNAKDYDASRKAKTEAEHGKDKYADRDFSSDLAEAHKAGYSEQTEEGKKPVTKVEESRKSKRVEATEYQKSGQLSKDLQTSNKVLDEKWQEHSKQESSTPDFSKMSYSEAGKYVSEHKKDFGLKAGDDAYMTAYEIKKGIWKGQMPGQESSTSTIHETRLQRQAVNEKAGLKSDRNQNFKTAYQNKESSTPKVNPDWGTDITDSVLANGFNYDTVKRGDTVTYVDSKGNTFSTTYGMRPDKFTISNERDASGSRRVSRVSDTEWSRSDGTISNNAGHHYMTPQELAQKGIKVYYSKGSASKSQDSLSASMNERSRIRGELHAKDKAMKAAIPTTVSGLRSAYADATGSMKSKIAAELRRKGYSLVGGKWVKGRKE